MNLLSARRLKPRQQEHKAHLRGLPAPPLAGRGESPQGDLVPFVAANSFAGFASCSLVVGSISSGAVSRDHPTASQAGLCHFS